MKIEPGKTYVTQDGYVVEIHRNLYTTHRCSPGFNGNNKDVATANGSTGWHYQPDGTLYGLAPVWSKKLTITEESPFPIPDLPEGFAWAGGYPQLKVPKKGQWFIRWDYSSRQHTNIVNCHGSYTVPYGAEARRFIVEPIIQDVKNYIQKDIPDGYVEVVDEKHQMRSQDLFKTCKDGGDWANPHLSIGSEFMFHKIGILIAPIIPFSGEGKYRLANGQIVNLDKNSHCLPSDGIENTNGNKFRWYWNKDGTFQGPFKNCKHLYLIEKIDEESPSTYPMYYKHPTKFADDTLFVKRISEDKFDIITKSGKLLKRDHAFVKSTANAWIQVSEKEVDETIASLSKSINTDSNMQLTQNHSVQKITIDKSTTVRRVLEEANLIKPQSFVRKSLNYLIIEPAKDTFTFAIKSIRYVIFGSLIGGIGYTGVYVYNNPQEVKDIVKPYIPKISVEAPKILG